jgi:cysteine-rich repeat protein
MRTCLQLVALYAVAVAAAACSFSSASFTLVENCSTPGDEDGNGFADCDDPACAAAPSCHPLCGNGKVEAGEACDDGNANNGDACESDCTLPTCGNGIIDSSEQCDDGPANNADDRDCRSDCMFNRCGDGRANTKGAHHEDCDAAPRTPEHSSAAVPAESADCNIDCTTARCGDRKINSLFTPPGATAPEQCDNGTGVNADDADCTATCQVNVCGDDHVNSVGPLHKEGCDDGNQDDSDGCTNACISKSCGDGIVGTDEECDLGAQNSDTGACLVNCRLATCGDGKVRSGVEECDGTAGLQPCSASCHQQRCGNGSLDPGEDCDLGDRNSDTGACLASCRLAFCGDGKVEAGVEECDGAAGPQPCSLSCHQQRCGNGIIDPMEECDDGALNSDDRDCRSDCVANRCGDGRVNTLGVHVEACDDGNHLNGDGCEADCTRSACGNGIVDPGEQCDDGNTLTCGSCSADCQAATSASATGTIFPVAGSGYAQNDAFTLSDGAITSTFEFTKTTAGGGHVPIVINGTESVLTMATRIRDAIQTTGLKIAPTAVNGVVLLQHRRPTSTGNVPITEAVGAPGFTVFGMTGGLGGNCTASQGCVDNDDCASHLCASGTCQ